MSRASRIGVLLVLTMLCCGCIMLSSTTVPHANFKISLPPGETVESTIDKVAAVARSAGYIETMNDWEVWKPILPEDQLRWKKMERRFKKQHFEVSFSPLLGLPENTTSLRLSFYEHDAYQFSSAGVAEFELLTKAFVTGGLVLLDETEDDRSKSHPITTPAEFNATHHAPSISDRSSQLISATVGLLVYGLIILLPGFLLMRTLSRVGKRSLRVQRTAFVVLATALLAPAPMLASMFGPLLLVPMALGYTFVFSLPEAMAPFILWSFAGTFVISLLVSLVFVKDSANADEAHRVVT